jgi:hypothetical protein
MADLNVPSMPSADSAGKKGRRRPRPLQLGVFVEAPLFLLGWLVFSSGGRSTVGYDFAIFRQAGDAVLHGRSPYVKPTVALLSQNTHFVYPAPFAYPFVPFALIGERLGAIIFLVLSVAAIVVSLRLLEVRDWRLYGLSILGVPTFSALGFGTIGPLLLLAAAASWRLRRSPWSGVLLALAAAAKLFMWPLLIWLLLTRRFRASVAAAGTLGVLVAFWAATNWAGLAEYPATLRALERGHPSSYSPRSLWLAMGLPGAQFVAVTIALVGVVLISRARDDKAGFSAAIAVSLLATPLLWLHYLVLLLIPLALYRPRLSWLWLLPLGLWVTPEPEPHASIWRIGVVVATVIVVWVGGERRLLGPRWLTSRLANHRWASVLHNPAPAQGAAAAD